jgi:hypothetical protein
MVISMTIISVLTTATAWMVVRGRHLWLDGRERSHARAQLGTAGLTLARELEDAREGTLSYTQDEISFESAWGAGRFQSDGAGRPVWREWVTYRRAGDRLLRRASATTEVLAGITAFHLVADAGRLRLQMAVQTRSARGASWSESLELPVAVRNR